MNRRYLWVKHLTAVNYFNGKKHRNANVAENHFALSMRFLGKQRESWIAINELMARTNGAGGKLAARLGLEPRQNESESFVLPLHHRAVKNTYRGRTVGPGGEKMEPAMGFEPATACLQNRCSTIELHRQGVQGTISQGDWQTTRNLVAPPGLEPGTN